jgi:hypothetical protein
MRELIAFNILCRASCEKFYTMEGHNRRHPRNHIPSRGIFACGHTMKLGEKLAG